MEVVYIAVIVVWLYKMIMLTHLVVVLNVVAVVGLQEILRENARCHGNATARHEFLNNAAL